VVARAHLDRVLELDSDNSVALEERAELRVQDGDLEGALADLALVLLLDPAHEPARARVRELEEVRGTELPPELHPFGAALDEGSDGELMAEASAPPVDSPGIREGEPGAFLVTRTMGDLYARQGLMDRAAEVYEQLLVATPDDPELSIRLAELRSGTGGAGPRSPSLSDGEDRSASSVAGAAQATPGTPDSTSEDASAGSVSSADGERTIGVYFGDLMAWVPGAVPIAALAPDPLPDAAAAAGEPATPSGGAPEESGGAGSPDFEAWLRGLTS